MEEEDRQLEGVPETEGGLVREAFTPPMLADPVRVMEPVGLEVEEGVLRRLERLGVKVGERLRVRDRVSEVVGDTEVLGGRVREMEGEGEMETEGQEDTLGEAEGV